MAGYNTGPNRLKRSSQSKREALFGTQIYTPAATLLESWRWDHVLSHLKDYGFTQDLNDGWPQEPLLPIV